MTLKDLKLIKPNTILVDKSMRLAYKENIVLAQVIDDKELKMLTCIIPFKRVREVNKLKSSKEIIDFNKRRIKNKLNNFFNIIEMYNKQGGILLLDEKNIYKKELGIRYLHTYEEIKPINLKDYMILQEMITFANS
jgi:hypothetical protein